MRIVIIEDEELTAEDLSDTLLAINPAIAIVGILPSVKEAIAFLKTKPELDLIFSDIQLEDGLSFEIYERVSVLTPIVFCTAYNEYALEAFKANGIDYILKPFARKEIETALAKYENLQRNFTRGIQQVDKLHELYANQPLKKSTNALLIYHKDQIIPIKFKDVAIFYLRNGITYLKTFSGNTFVVEQHLEELEQQAGEAFFRANRQHLVNKEAIQETVHHFARKLLVKLNLNFEEEIIISKVKAPLYLGWLSN